MSPGQPNHGRSEIGGSRGLNERDRDAVAPDDVAHDEDHGRVCAEPQRSIRVGWTSSFQYAISR